MRTRILWPAFAVGAMLIGCPVKKDFDLHGKRDDFDDPVSQKAAEKILKHFRDSLDEVSAHLFGFETMEGGKGARLGDPIAKWEWDCGALMAYDSGKTGDFAAIKGYKDTLFRVKEKLANGEMPDRSFIFLRKLRMEDTSGREGDWRPMQVGATYYRGKVDSAIEGIPENHRKEAVLIEAPALQAAFLGYSDNGVQYLSPIRLTEVPDTSCIRWPKEGRLPARQALAGLSICLQAHKERCEEPKP